VTARAVLFIAHGDAEIAIGHLRCDRANLELIDALARLQLSVRRLGCSIRLRDVTPDLHRLLDLTGLSECLQAVEIRRD
jgi:hypothetical protein